MTNSRVFDKKKLIDSLAIVVGVLLIAGAVGILIAQADFSEKQTADSVVRAMKSIMPPPQRAFPEPHYGKDMPSTEVGGESFVGLLEIEQYDTLLPVATNWADKDLKRFPMVYSGNIYNRDLIIGAGNNEGQFDFADEIEIGASIHFVDLYGHEFCYEVSMVNHLEDIASIDSGDDDLTIFAKSKTTSKYVIIRCGLSQKASEADSFFVLWKRES
jgi:hypothetical protein